METPTTQVLTTHTTWEMERDYILAVDKYYTKVMVHTEKLLASALTTDEKLDIIAKAGAKCTRKGDALMRKFCMEKIFVPEINQDSSTPIYDDC